MKEAESDIPGGISWQSDRLRTPWESVPFARDFVVISLFFCVVFFGCFANRELANPDEGRYAEIPREMLQTGDWVTPRLNGVKYFEKPPFVYWAEAVCIAVLGPSEWSLRVPPAVFSLGGVLLTYLVARKLYGRTAGLTAAAILASSALYFALSGVLLLDVAVSVLITATLVCFILGVRTPPGARRRWIFHGLYASAALATLTKGLIGFLLPGAIMFLWLLLFNQWRRLLPLYLPTGSALFLLIAAPWHVLAASRNPEWAQFYFVQEHWQRFTTKTHDRYEPWWFFVPVLLVGFAPWTGFVAPALRSLVRGGVGRIRENADSWFFVVWAGFVFLFFSASDSKLIPYVLPVLPPIAILVGRWRVVADGKGGRGWKIGFGVFAVFAVVLAAALVYAVAKDGVIRDSHDRELAVPYAYTASAILVLGTIAAGFAARGVRWSRAWAVLFATALGCLCTFAFAANDLVSTGTKQLALIFNAQARPDERVFHYHTFFHDFTYYAQRTVSLVGTEGVDHPFGELELEIDAAARESGRFVYDAEFRRLWAGPERMWMVVRRRDAAPLFSEATFQYHVIGESNGRLLLSNQPTHEPDRPS